MVLNSPYYFGGLTAYRTGWLGPRAVYVDFLSEYATGWVYQLYAGRRLIGATAAPRERRVSGQLLVDDAPCPLTLLRVRPGLRGHDFGHLLPPLPWHRYRLTWTAADYPPDATAFEITANRSAGAPVDPSHVLALVPYSGEQPYDFDLPPLASAGLWVVRITPRDDAEPNGNPGPAVEVQVQAHLPPADVRPRDDRERFSLRVAAGILIAEFAYA
jgi:hypothetical protein